MSSTRILKETKYSSLLPLLVQNSQGRKTWWPLSTSYSFNHRSPVKHR